MRLLPPVSLSILRALKHAAETGTLMKLVMCGEQEFELWNAPDWFAVRLRQEFPDLQVVEARDGASIERVLADAEIAVTGVLTPAQVNAAHILRWIHSPGTAVNALLIPEIVASDIIVTNAREVPARIVAEHALALMLALSRRLPSALRMQRQHQWSQKKLWSEFPKPREMAESVL